MTYTIELSFDEYVGRKIQQERKRRRETQEDMAKALGISSMGLSYIENGQRPLKASLFVKIAEHQQRSFDYYLPPKAL